MLFHTLASVYTSLGLILFFCFKYKGRWHINEVCTMKLHALISDFSPQLLSQYKFIEETHWKHSSYFESVFVCT